jgi:NADH:ubiquinone reductase (H+-translocating)
VVEDGFAASLAQRHLVLEGVYNGGMSKRPSVVILGAGFGGLKAAKRLRKAPVDIVLIDRMNHHLFQPLLYQVATATLSPADIAYPVRSALSGQKNTEVRMAEITGIDKALKRVLYQGGSIEYDFLVAALGSRQSYFGHPEWESFATGLKDLSMATSIRQKILRSFELAEMEANEEKRREEMTFILVGGGPTGVEMAGAISELATRVIARDFRKIDPKQTRVILMEGGPRLLASFPESLSARAERDLKKLGVEVRTGCVVEKVDAEGVVAKGERIRCPNVFWTAGVTAAPVGKWLGLPVDRSGRVFVDEFLHPQGHPEIFVLGDCASAPDEKGQPLPGLAPVAMQQGDYAGRQILAKLKDKPAKPFHYFDKGNMATIGRSKAVVALGQLRFTGLFAWVTWLAVHLFFLIGFRNRLLVLLQWAWAYIRFQSGARLILPERRTPDSPRPSA